MEAATATKAAPVQRGRSERPWWRESLAPYAQPHIGRSLLDVATSVVPYLAVSVSMYFLLDVSLWLVLAVGILNGGFLLRTYILFHDCTHGSFLPSKRANHVVGAILGVLVYSPFQAWRHDHAVHHASAGDLDRRGVGDVPTLTVREYYAKPWGERIGYYLFRHPLVMFGIGPMYALVIQPRRSSKDARPRNKRSTYLTNIVLVLLVGAICSLIGWKAFL